MSHEGVKQTGESRQSVRVGYLLRMYPRFSQTFVVNEIRELERQGLDVSIISLRKPNEGLFHESVCRVKARAHYAPTPYRGRLREVAKTLWQLLRRSPRDCWRAGKIIRGDAEAEWFDLARAAHVLRWAREHDVDHLHVHFGTSAATVALLASVLGGLPYSLTLHAFDIFRDDVKRSLLSQKISASRFTITVSEFNRRFLVDNLPGVDAQKIRVNYNGVDLERFQPTADRRDTLSIFGLGRLKEKKGFIHLIRAVRRLHDNGLSVRCRIAGEGPEEPHLRNAIARWGVESLVELMGPVNEDQVRELMQHSSCFVLPCVQANDGNIDALPTVLLEALASGCPSVSTRLSGVPEIIEDGVSGLLVEPGDDKALAGAIRKVLLNPDLAASLARGGRRRAVERFDIRRNVAVMHQWLRTETTRVCAWSGARQSGGEAVAVEAREAQTAVASAAGERGSYVSEA
ncbi:MAG: glycosyltransferase family 4 protein [Phycisphaerae bacterium]